MTPLELTLLLAQMCVSEVSFQRNAAECIVMVETNQKGATRRDIPLERQTLEFNAVFDPRTDVKRTWIFKLNLTGRMPEGWHGSIHSWKRFRPMWMNYLRVIRKWVKDRDAGTPPRLLCRQADDYGGGMDNALPECAVLVTCLGGDTHQRYWSLRQCRRFKKSLRTAPVPVDSQPPHAPDTAARTSRQHEPSQS